MITAETLVNKFYYVPENPKDIEAFSFNDSTILYITSVENMSSHAGFLVRAVVFSGKGFELWGEYIADTETGSLYKIGYKTISLLSGNLVGVDNLNDVPAIKHTMERLREKTVDNSITVG